MLSFLFLSERLLLLLIDCPYIRILFAEYEESEVQAGENFNHVLMIKKLCTCLGYARKEQNKSTIAMKQFFFFT